MQLSNLETVTSARFPLEHDDDDLGTVGPVIAFTGHLEVERPPGVVFELLAEAAVMVASTRLAILPKWLIWVTVVAAALLVVTGPSVIMMLLLPIWVATVALLTRGEAPITRYAP